MDFSQNLIQQQIDIYHNLMDEESKLIYRSNLIWRLMGNEMFYKSVQELDTGRDFGDNELMHYDYFKNQNYRGIILFGCGGNSVEFYYQLKALGYRIAGFADNDQNKIHKTMFDYKVIDAKILIEEYADAFVVITPQNHRDDIFRQLVTMGFCEKNICIPVTGQAAIYNVTSRQYFDLPQPKENEVYVDAGAFDGQTILDFLDWCKGSYKEIYAFEPSPCAYKQCLDKIANRGVENCTVYNKGLYSEASVIRFDDSLYASGAAAFKVDGSIVVETVALDAVLKGKRATFIKMDIEGSELSALKGAKETITKWHPRLAISLYHQTEDFFTIPLYIKTLYPQYHFYIRKYTPHHGEMVLYALCDEI